MDVVARVGEGHGRHEPEFRADQPDEVLFLLALRSGMTMTVRYPRAFPTSARPMPVLPAVPSTIVPPGRMRPRASASSMMASARDPLPTRPD